VYRAAPEQETPLRGGGARPVMGFFTQNRQISALALTIS
jgi:hypothetical protein